MARTALGRRWQRTRRRYFPTRRDASPADSGAELDALAEALDLARLSPQQFVQLLVAIHAVGEAGAGVHLSSMSTQSLVNLFARMTKDQVRAISEDEVLRTFVLEEIFRRMAEHLIAEKVLDLSVAVTWHFTRPEDSAGYDVFQTVIDDGVCSTTRELVREATTVTLSVFDFIRMATGGNAVAAAMFVRGRLKIKGDYALAATITGYFNIPRPN